MIDPDEGYPDPNAEPDDPSHPMNMLAEGALEPEDVEYLQGSDTHDTHDE